MDRVGNLLLTSGVRRLASGPAGGGASWRSPWVAPGGALLCLLDLCGGAYAGALPSRHPVSVGYEETGKASWYGRPHHGRRTASGEVYNMKDMTAAHPSLPLGTWVLVKNLNNGRTAKVRINDRGPYRGRRILDLSQAAARALGAKGGVIRVRLRVIRPPHVQRSPGALSPTSLR